MGDFIPRKLLWSILTTLCLILCTASPRAQKNNNASNARTQELIDLVRQQPTGMDRDTWREARREAARELGTLGARQAVPLLIEVIKTEKFDSLAEIAVVSLGKIGDRRAIPALTDINSDNSRDRYIRKLAATALQKMGGRPENTSPSDDQEIGVPASNQSSQIGSEDAERSKNPTSNKFASDILAASEHLTFAVGESHLGYDSISNEAFVDGQASANFVWLREGKSIALRYEGRGNIVAGVINYDGDDSNARVASVNLAGSAEARVYNDRGTLFGIGIGTALVGADHIRVHRPGIDNTTKTTLLSGDLTLALGGGYGRIINVGEQIRIRRLEEVLRRRKSLGRRISPDIYKRLMESWWGIRDELGYHNRLVATINLLRESGVLLTEPDASTSYALLQVLSDGQVSHRLSGLQAYAAMGESVLARDDSLGIEEGRVESLFSRVSYGRQNFKRNSEWRVDADARIRVLGDEQDLSPWAVGVTSHWRDFHYGPNFDPKGALDIEANIAASSDGASNSEFTAGVGGSLGWLWTPSRASRVRLAAEARIESAELFVGIGFDGQYGLLDVGYVKISE